MSLTLLGCGKGTDGSAFNPLTLSPSLWAKGDGANLQTSGGSAASADGDPVGQGTDGSSNGNHLLQATAGKRFVLKTGANGLNGLPILRGSAAAGAFLGAAFTLPQPVTLFLVWRYFTAPTLLLNAFDGGVAVRTIVRANATDPTLLDVYGGAFLTQTLPANAGNWNLDVYVFNGASSKVRRGRADFATGNAGANAPAGFTFGALADGTRAADVALAEAILMPAVATAPQIVSAESYLARWGV